MRYRGIYKAADGRYRSAGTFSTEERALAVAEEAERHAAELVDGAAGGLDPATRATRTIAEYATKARLTEEEIRALGDCEPVGGRVYAHGTLGGYVQAKCRCAGCRQWARDYGREGCGSGVRLTLLVRFGGGGRSLVMPTSPTLTSRSGTGSGRERSRKAESRSSRPLIRCGTRTPRG